MHIHVCTDIHECCHNKLSFLLSAVQHKSYIHTYTWMYPWIFLCMATVVMYLYLHKKQ